MKIILKKSLLAISFFLMSLAAICQDLTVSFDTLMNRQFPASGTGAAVLVAKDGNIIYEKAFGKANLELDVAMQPGNIFRIGSITKQFTACAILKLSEQGKLSLKDTLTQYIPDYPTLGNKITIEHLLTHTSGIKNYTELPAFMNEVIRKDLTPTELIAVFKDEPVDFAPGENYHYTNSGYVLLGYIIEKVSNKTYAEYMTETFFKPLALNSTFYNNLSNVVKGRIAGYKKQHGQFFNADYLSMSLPYAGGSLVSTVQDLFRWNQALISGKVISNESLKKAQTSFTLNTGEPTGYGFGWETGNIQGVEAVQHGGSINGFRSYAVYLPGQNVFVTIFSNSESNVPDMTASRMAALTIGKPYTETISKMSDEMLRSYEAIYEFKNQSRKIRYEGSRLVIFSTGGRKTDLIPIAPDKFLIAGTLESIEFSKGGDKKPTAFIERSTKLSEKWELKSNDFAKQKKGKVSSENLDKYLGVYEMKPNFNLEILKDGDKLFAHREGSDEANIELIPFDTHQFLIKEFDAQIDFGIIGEEKATTLTLIQNGELKGKRVK